MSKKKVKLKWSDQGPAVLDSYVANQKSMGVLRGALPKPSSLFSQSQFGDWWRQKKNTESAAKNGFNLWYGSAIKKHYGELPGKFDHKFSTDLICSYLTPCVLLQQHQTHVLLVLDQQLPAPQS